MRETILTPEFKDFFHAQSAKVQAKLDFAIDAVRERETISTKLVKKLVDTDYYELRISMDNEYRVVLLAVDHNNITQAKMVYFLNGFVKKSTKDYRKQLVTTTNIVKALDL